MTTFTSGLGFVFYQPGTTSTAQMEGQIRLTIVAEAAWSGVTMFGAQSTVLANILRAGSSPSSGDFTPHDGVLTINGTGLPDGASWTYGLGILRWGAGAQAYILMGQDSVSGREMMIPLSTGSVSFPTISSTTDLRAFLGSVTNFSFAGASAILSNLVGTLNEHDYVSGTANADSYSVGIGDDTVYGGAGSDRIWGGADDDSLNGDTGNDSLYGDEGNDILSGGEGNDRLFGGADQDWLSGGDNSDLMLGDAGNDTLDGDAGNDSLEGGDGNDRLNGGDGNDQMRGDLGSDRLYGGAGNDVMSADWGIDRLFGGAGNDRLYTDGYISSVDNGPDELDYLYGGLGDDIFQDGDETSLGVNKLYGGAGNDTISGTGSDSIYGEAGNDVVLRIGAGASLVEGGAGNDALTGGVGRDSLFGGVGNDRITGSGAANSLSRGGLGDDTLTANNLVKETLKGDAGADVFVLNLTSSAVQAALAVGGSGVDRVIFGTFDTVSDITRNAAGITITGGEGGRVTFAGIEEFQMGGFGVMTADAFFDFWVDVLP